MNIRFAGRVALLLLAASLLWGPAAALSEQDPRYRGNVQTKIFHQSECRYFNCQRCTREFWTREDAIKAGYRPCKICRP